MSATPATAARLQEIRALADSFPIQGNIVDVRPQGNGHINETLAVTFDQAGAPVRYIFQRINHHIFQDVPGLMENVGRVTEHLATQDSTGRGALTLQHTWDRASFYQRADGEYWRVFVFIERATTYDELQSPAQAFEAARAFGAFQHRLSDLPGPPLHETIPHFHDTRKRFQTLLEAAQKDVTGRAGEVARELEFVQQRESDVDRLLGLAREGSLPQRVTHNDTKINNVMLDDQTGEGICVIDLDTVMPGLSLYDFGDMVRTAISPAAEDERDLAKIVLRMPVFEALALGFVEGAGPMLTAAERDNLVFSGKLMTFEVGMRFLTDYLQGDTYFKIKRPDHNLDRCRAQFRLVECLEKATDKMTAVVRGLRT